MLNTNRVRNFSLDKDDDSSYGGVRDVSCHDIAQVNGGVAVLVVVLALGVLAFCGNCGGGETPAGHRNRRDDSVGPRGA